MEGEYNHPLASTPFVFHQHRKLDVDSIEVMAKMLKAEAKPTLVCDTMRDEDPKRQLIPKDVSNLRACYFKRLTTSMDIWQNILTSVITSFVSSTIATKELDSFLCSIYQK